MSFARSANRAFYRLTGYRVSKGWYPDGIDPDVIKVFEQVKPYTMTNIHRIDALMRVVDYVVSSPIVGDFVECGVWRGGSTMAAAIRFLELGDVRQLWLYDTFEGMPEPDKRDVNRFGTAGRDIFDRHRRKGESWLDVGIDEVESNIQTTGYPNGAARLVKGLVEDTIPAEAPEAISILRLDTDLYSSTAHELEHLVPRISPGGVLIIDDYGSWAGARAAVDEYFGSRPVFLHRVDHACRVIVV